MQASAAYIAGVGLSSSTDLDIDHLGISAATKALLDAGVTYAKVELSISCFLDEPRLRIPRSCFKAFGRRKGTVSEIDGHSALSTAIQCVRSGQTDCALLVGIDSEPSSRDHKTSQVAAVGIVLVSDRFMISHAYLKDSAAQIRACISTPVADPRTTVQEALRRAGLENRDIQLVETQGKMAVSNTELGFPSRRNSADVLNKVSAGVDSLKDFGMTGLVGLCRLVWQLRGWTHEARADLQNCMQCISRPDEADAAVLVLCRADGRSAPAYTDVKYLRDGRERLGHNPAEEMREIDKEDLEAVRTREGDRMLKSGAEEGGRMRIGSRGGDRAALARL